jgi:hypothetical protein
MTSTIKIAYVNPPKSAKGPGNVKTDDGKYFKVWPTTKIPKGATLGDFEVGNTYEVECDEEQYNGKPQYTVRKIVSEDFLTGKDNGTARPATTVRSTSTNGSVRTLDTVATGFYAALGKADELVTQFFSEQQRLQWSAYEAADLVLRVAAGLSIETNKR